jgi:hypothetical protein
MANNSKVAEELKDWGSKPAQCKMNKGHEGTSPNTRHPIPFFFHQPK